MKRPCELLLVASLLITVVGAGGCTQPSQAFRAVNLGARQWSTPERRTLDELGFVIVDDDIAGMASLYPERPPKANGQEQATASNSHRFPVMITADAVLYAQGRILRKQIQFHDEYVARYWHACLPRLTMEISWAKGKTDISPEGLDKALELAETLRTLLVDDTAAAEGDGVAERVRAIRRADGFGREQLTGSIVDYTLCEVPESYCSSEALKGYYQAKMWLSQIRFDLNEKADRQAFALVTLLLARDPDVAVYLPDMSMGRRDPTTVRPQDIWNVLAPEGAQSGWDRVSSIQKRGLKRSFAILDEAIRKRAEQHTARTSADGGKLQGVLLERAQPVGNAILAETAAGRVPSGLSVLAGLHGGTARAVLMGTLSQWEQRDLTDRLQRARRHIRWSEHPDLEWLTHQVLESLIATEAESNWPLFMQTDAYRMKSLQTAAAAWAEHRARWVLHLEEYRAVFGAPKDVPDVGFVEPHDVFWGRMVALAAKIRRTFGPGSANVNDQFLSIAVDCQILAKRQLAGEFARRHEDDVFGRFGRLLRKLDEQDTNESGGAKTDDAYSAMVARDPLNGLSLYVGTLPPRAMYCVMPMGDRFVVVRGGVMRYRECVIRSRGIMSKAEWLAECRKIDTAGWLHAGEASSGD